MSLDRRLWTPLFGAIVLIVVIFGAWQAHTAADQDYRRSDLDCSGVGADQPRGCYR